MEQFGKYTLVKKIGSGGMAEVYFARTSVAQGLTKTLVIKKIHPAYARSRQFVTMFIDEAKIALGLNHPNIVQVFDFGAVGDTYFLAMEYVEGGDLLRLLQDCANQKIRIPYRLSTYMAQQIAKGLDYAHRKCDEFGEPLGIVHRDISPQNVLLSWDGGVKIVDFGIARARDVHEDEGVIKGKFSYMSPEQARGEPVDRRSDVFAAGIVLYEMVCARPLFPGKGKEALELVRSGAVPSPREFAPQLPESLERIMLRALAFHRDDRYQTARDFQTDLGRFQVEHALRTGELTDSGMLAQFLSSAVPAQRRQQAARLPGEVSGRIAVPQGAAASVGTPTPDPHASSARASDMRERKHVYVLAGVVRGMPALERRLGAEAAAKLLAAFAGIVKDVAFKHEGLLDLRAQGDAGLRLVVGLPTASEDDADRAIRTALALVDALDGIGSDVEPELRLAVGIQRGVAQVTRRAGATFDVEEATASFADQLARQARGAEILVGGRVFRAARADWKFEALAAIDLPAEMPLGTQRGDDETDPGVRRARVYRLAGRKERAQRLRDRPREGRTHGRHLELKALRDAYRDTLVSRRKRQVLVIGEPGVGKRTLVAEFLDTVPASEAFVVRTSTRVATALTPFAVVADLARDVLGLAEDSVPQEIERRLLRALPLLYPSPEDQRDAQLALQTLGLLLGSRGLLVEEHDGGERRRCLFDVMRRVERLLEADRPLVVVGEDVHWADQESLDLFVALLREPNTRPIFGVMTARADPRLLRVTKEAGTELLILDELSAPARRQMITDRFVPSADIGPLVEQLAQRAGGNPFFINELLDALIERGVLVADGDDGEHPGLLRWVQRDAALTIPSTVEDALVTRFDRLPGGEKEVLLCAAVLGRAVSANTVAGLLGRPVRLELDELVRRGILGPLDGEYCFKNDMAMTVAYGLIGAELRSRFHRDAAAKMGDSASYHPATDDAIIARHLELAGDALAAADRYLRSAAHAIDVGGNADAFRQLTRALKLLPPTEHESRFVAHQHRAEILRRMARRPEQLVELQEMARHAEALVLPQRLAKSYAALAQFHIEVGAATAATAATAAVEQALRFARESEDRIAEAEAVRLRAAVAHQTGEFLEALKGCDDGLHIVGVMSEELDASLAENEPRRTSGVLLARATLCELRGAALWGMGKLEEAIDTTAEALVLYRGLGFPRLEAQALGRMGVVLAALTEYEEALAHHKSALKIVQHLGDRAGLAQKLGNLGSCYFHVGDDERAESYLRKALELAEQCGELFATAEIMISLGQLRLASSDVRGAFSFFERGLGLATQHRDKYQEVRARIFLALTQLRAKQRPAGAFELARSATTTARKMPMEVGVVYGLAVQALAMSELGLHNEAIGVAEEAVGRLGAGPRVQGQEPVLRWSAEVYTQAGRVREAQLLRERAQRVVDACAGQLRDPGLRRLYWESRARRF